MSSAQQVLCATSKAAAAQAAGSASGSRRRKRKASTQSTSSRTGVSTCLGCCIVVSSSVAVEPAPKPPPVVLTDVWSDDSGGDEGEQHICTGRMQPSSRDRRRQQELATKRMQEQLRFKEWCGSVLRLGFVCCLQSSPWVLCSNMRVIVWCRYRQAHEVTTHSSMPKCCGLLPFFLLQTLTERSSTWVNKHVVHVALLGCRSRRSWKVPRFAVRCK